VDAASGTESAPGRKDPTKLREFFAAVREADMAARSLQGDANAVI
jgi:hypothetical protein